MLLELLRSDLERQYELEGKRKGVTLWSIFIRLPNPRFLPIVLYRASRSLMLSGVPFIPHIFSYINLILFGIQITPKCEIGSGLFLPHTVGTVIGAWRIGSNATIFQNVTLGAKSVDMFFNPNVLPHLGNNVTVGAGAKILGAIHIGDHVTVGANSVVVRTIPPGLTVVGVPAREVTAKNK